MSILSTVTGAVSKVSGLSVRTKVEIGLVAALALALFLGWLWLSGLQETNATQAREIGTLSNDKAALNQEKVQLQTDKAAAVAQRDVYAQRTEELNQEIKNNEKNAEKYRKDSEEVRRQLAELQKNDPCAVHPVPDDVIRVQQQNISAHNARYSG
ncbi:hypothetical protein [Enterobacter soli]|uniref:hypothetical protein n=1 Tax=Enterobacter soli TaxID=885040 RepID=UPI002F3E7305